MEEVDDRMEEASSSSAALELIKWLYSVDDSPSSISWCWPGLHMMMCLQRVS